LAIITFTSGGDTNVANRCLELDQRVGLVVREGRAGFAIGAEVRIVADSTLVSNTSDIIVLSHTKRTVAADAIMNGSAVTSNAWLAERLIDRNEAVVGVHKASVEDAVSAVVPVRAVEALVADASDELFAAIADGVVDLVPARRKFGREVVG
jgi:hypothetical protein